MKTRYILLVYLVMWIFTAGTLVRDMSCGHLAPIYCQEDYRTDLSMGIFFAALPPMWVSAPFITGFWQYGWGFGRCPRNCQ